MSLHIHEQAHSHWHFIHKESFDLVSVIPTTFSVLESLTHISNCHSGVPFLYGTSAVSLGECMATMVCVVLHYIYLLKSVLRFIRLWAPWRQQNGNHVFSSWPNQCSAQVPGMQSTFSNCFLETNWNPVRSRLAKLYQRNPAKLFREKALRDALMT